MVLKTKQVKRLIRSYMYAEICSSSCKGVNHFPQIRTMLRVKNDNDSIAYE